MIGIYQMSLCTALKGVNSSSSRDFWPAGPTFAIPLRVRDLTRPTNRPAIWPPNLASRPTVCPIIVVSQAKINRHGRMISPALSRLKRRYTARPSASGNVGVRKRPLVLRSADLFSSRTSHHADPKRRFWSAATRRRFCSPRLAAANRPLTSQRWKERERAPALQNAPSFPHKLLGREGGGKPQENRIRAAFLHRS